MGRRPGANFGSAPVPLIRPEEFDTETIRPKRIEELYLNQSGFGPRYRVIERIEGTGPGLIRGLMFYPDSRDFAGASKAAPSYPLYLLEGLTQLMGFYPLLRREVDKLDMFPVGMEALELGRDCTPGRRLELHARLRQRSGPVLTWDALAADASGEVIMIATGYTLKRFGL